MPELLGSNDTVTAPATPGLVGQSGAAAHCDTSPAVDWLIDGARSAATPEDALTQLCERLLLCDMPLWRVGVFVRTLHPQIMGIRVLWRQGLGAQLSEAPHRVVETEEFRGSPVVEVYATGQRLRRRLADPDCPMDFAVLGELRAEGATDYLVLPLAFTDGSVHVATWTTQRPGGFTPQQLAGIEAIVRPLTRVVEARTLRRTAMVLLNTYVGNHAGERILAGHIRRGDTQAVDAAIWFSDMRGSTALAEILAPEIFIDLLNRFFDCQVPAIVEHGGEVLKFMGDGLLAIFPIDAGDTGEVCRQALAAARIASAAVGELATPPTATLQRPRLGLALHLGRVLYGNVGSANRLDFTCIGPAVNLAARLERLAGELGHAVLASQDFAACCNADEGLARLGAFRLPGISADQTVYALNS